MRAIVIAAVLLIMLPLSVKAADIAKWRVLPEKSEIGFTASYGKQPIIGSFPSYDADIRFDAAHLDQSRIKVRIEMAKVASGDKDAQENLPLADWFDITHFPVATFETTRIRPVPVKKNLGPGLPYIAEGNLTIRGKTVPVTLPFMLDIFKGDGPDAGKTFARVSASVSLKRLDFGIGQGQWADVATVKNEVEVQVKLQAVNP